MFLQESEMPAYVEAGSGCIKACEVYAKASAATNADSSKK